MEIQRVTKLEKRWSTEQLITGVELPEWIEILKDNDFKVSREYLHRLAFITGMSVPSTIFGRLEDAIYARKLAQKLTTLARRSRGVREAVIGVSTS